MEQGAAGRCQRGRDLFGMGCSHGGCDVLFCGGCGCVMCILTVAGIQGL